MAMNDGSLGISFAPSVRERRQQDVGSPLQRAIQVLSLRLPRFVGSRAPIPQGLLAAGGGGSGLGNSVVQSVLASLAGPQAGGAVNPWAATAASLAGPASLPGPQAGGAGD